MAIFKYYIDHVGKALAPTPSARLDRNFIDTAEFAALTMGMSEAKKAVYKRALQERGQNPQARESNRALSGADLSGVADFHLNTGGRISPHKASANELVRSNIIFKINDALQIELIDVVAKITLANTIVSTALYCKSGSVKEYIQAQDYEITLTGQLISSSQNAFPYHEMSDFVEILREDDSIAVSGILLSAFDIHRVVLKKATFDQGATKFANTLNFQLELLSDEDVKLTMEDY